jgi:Integrase core domain
VGDSYDNAMAESTIGLYKTEMVWPEGPWRDVDHLEPATADHVYWFNNHRIHSGIGYDTTVEHEESTTVKTTPASRSLPEKKPSTKPGMIQIVVRQFVALPRTRLELCADRSETESLNVRILSNVLYPLRRAGV